MPLPSANFEPRTEISNGPSKGAAFSRVILVLGVNPMSKSR